MTFSIPAALVGFSTVIIAFVLVSAINRLRKQKITPEMEALAQQAKEGMHYFGIDDDSYIKQAEHIDEMLTGQIHYPYHKALLRQYAAHTKNHPLSSINATFFMMKIQRGKKGIPELISAESIDFFSDLNAYWFDNHERMQDSYIDLMNYGFANFGDAGYIRSVVRDGGAYSVDSIQAGVQQLKATKA